MAVSQMQRLSLVLPAADVDALLLALQDFGGVEILDLREEKDWQAAFETDQEYAETASAAELERAIALLAPYLPRKRLLDSLREEPLALSFEELEAAGQLQDERALLDGLSQQLQDLELAEKRISQLRDDCQRLEKWFPLELTPQELAQFSHVRAAVGSIPNDADGCLCARLEDCPALEYQEVFSSETEQGLLLFYPPGDQESVTGLLREIGFKAFEDCSDQLPRDRLAQLQAELAEQESQAQAVRTSLAAAGKVLTQLKMQTDYRLNAARRQEAKTALASTEYLAALEGWVEKAAVPELTACLHQRFGGRFLIETEDAAEEDWERVPIRLQNHALAEPFELVTEMYALPRYAEKDPTPLVSVFYFVFFGMMVADIGYGLLLFAGTAIGRRSFHLKDRAAKNLRFFRLLSLAVILWGAVYGSFFGFELPIRLISTSTDAMAILLVSVVFGFVTVLTGLFLSGVRHIRIRDYAEAYNSGFAWVLILIGLLLLTLGLSFPALAPLGAVGQWLALLNALGILLVSVAGSRSLAGLASGLFNLYNISSYVGDLVSFTRLMALGLSGASIGSAFNLIVSLFPPAVRFTVGILLFVLLHLINLFLSLLSGYVHGARLIFVEFFGKFYEGGGRAFQPLKPAEHYVKRQGKKT